MCATKQKTVTDPLSQEVFLPRHGNQKFKNTRNRIEFNNEKAKIIRQKKKSIQGPLDRNFYILEAELGQNDSVVRHKQFLFGRGFDFRFYTGTSLHKETKQVVYQIFTIYITKKEGENYDIFRSRAN